MHLFCISEIDDEDKKQEIEEKFTKLFRAVIDADNAISSSLYLMSSMTQEDIGHEKTTNHDLFRYTEIDYDKLSPYQSLLLYLLEQLQRKEYRRYAVEGNELCYQKIYNKEGYDTHAWKPAMTIKNFILDVTRKDLNFAMFLNLTQAKENRRAATTYLTEYLGPEFEDIIKDRNVFSFTNGVYFTLRRNEETGEFYDEFIEFGTKKIGASVVSCKLFDVAFDTSVEEDWFEYIKKNCPNFISVMEYQEWPEEVQRWLCIMIGRMFYKVGQYDDWQIIPYLLGTAGTGKSTILENIIKILYEPADVGVLSNNIERKFGLSALMNKLIFIGPEIKGNLSLEQAEFQSMVSGETVQAAIKHGAPVTTNFNPPGMLAGNEVPAYPDNAGSITRRVVAFAFDNKVKKGDTKLGFKIKKEIASIIKGSNKGYLNALNIYGSSGIWDILPNYFKITQEMMAENTNSLIHFIKSDSVILGKVEEVYCSEKVFIAAFNDYCNEKHMGGAKWTHQFYSGPFADYGLKIIRNKRMRYPRKGTKTYNGAFILGIDVKEIVASRTTANIDDSDTEENMF